MKMIFLKSSENAKTGDIMQSKELMPKQVPV